MSIRAISLFAIVMTVSFGVLTIVANIFTPHFSGIPAFGIAGLVFMTLTMLGMAVIQEHKKQEDRIRELEEKVKALTSAQ